MQISKYMQLNYQIQVKNAYNSGKHIYRQKYNLHISVHCINSQIFCYPLRPPLQRNSTPELIKPWHFQQNGAQTLVPFTQSLHSDPQKDTHMSLYTLVAPDSPFHSTKFQPYTPSQSKVILTHVNSTSYPLDGLKCIPEIYHVGYHKYTPLHMCLENIA